MRRISLDELESALDRRKAELGFSGDRYVLPNSGVSRTAEKRELLKAIRDAASRSGKPSAFLPTPKAKP